MASIYLDHNVARDVATALRLNGHDVRTAREIHTENVGDDEHLALAYQNRWIFITHNISDFELLHDGWRRWSRLWGLNVLHPGILWSQGRLLGRLRPWLTSGLGWGRRSRVGSQFGVPDMAGVSVCDAGLSAC